MRMRLLAFILPLLLAVTVRPVYASAYYSIPIVGRWSTLQIGLELPPAPSWARSLILDAAQTWNLAQIWFQRNYFPDEGVYTFAASPSGNVTVSYGLPAEFASIAVGWTQYILNGASTIQAAHVFLDGGLFNSPEPANATGQEYGFRLALHELGRVLGLGSLVDGLDIMDPVGTISHASEAPVISFIDLFALHILASESSISSPTVILNTDQQIMLNAWNILGLTFRGPSSTSYANATATCYPD